MIDLRESQAEEAREQEVRRIRARVAREQEVLEYNKRKRQEMLWKIGRCVLNDLMVLLAFVAVCGVLLGVTILAIAGKWVLFGAGIAAIVIITIVSCEAWPRYREYKRCKREA